MKVFLSTLFLILLSQTSVFCQDSTPHSNQYLLDLNIPKDWEVKKTLEGKDYTLSAYSPDNKLFIYYCQFMNDEKTRPRRYFDTYTHQFGINSKPKIRLHFIKGKKRKFYFSNGEGEFIDERFKIIFFATSVNKRNIIAYLIYPLNSSSKVDEEVKKIMLFDR